MANNRVHRNESAEAHLPRTGHSLSHKFAYTAPFGMLLPTFWDYLQPGDKISIRTDYDLSRALPLLNPASIDVEVVTDYFFVPMDLMYMPFGEAYYGTDNIFSSIIWNEQPHNDCPLLGINSGNIRQHMYQFVNQDSFECFGKSLFRMFDMLGFDPRVVFWGLYSLTQPDSHSIYAYPAKSKLYVYPFPFLAYQACYQYFYRDEEREVFDPTCFNVDDFSGQDRVIDSIFTSSETSLNISRWNKITKLRYVNKRSDYFTDLSRSALITINNLNRALEDFGGKNFGLHDWLSETVGYGFLPLALNRSDMVVTDNSSTSVGTADVPSALNTATLRMLFANEKLLRITQAAKKNYDDQTLAHFGVNVPHDVKHQITHFGHDVMKYQVAEVVSTAQTEDGALGEQAGRLYGQKKSNGMSDFKAPVHGVVMAITFIRPSYMYVQPMSRLASYSEIGDFWKPEYDHIGMQPMFRYEAQFNAGVVVDGAQPYYNDPIGWQYRYSENKRRINRMSHAFTGGTYQSYLIGSLPLGHLGKGALNADTLPPNVDLMASPMLKSFKVSPADSDGIFATGFCPIWQNVCDMSTLGQSVEDARQVVGDIQPLMYGYTGADDLQDYCRLVIGMTGLDFNKNPYQIYATDPFILNADLKCTKVSFMSQNSLPKMDM